MENILKSKTLNATLKQKGYVIIPFLNSTEVTSLKEAYQKSHPNNPDGFYATTHANDVNFRKHANEQIKAVLNAPIKKNIQNINALGGAFISKSPNKKGVLPLHQDWNIVNEDKYQSYNIWIPLQDVDEYNGAVRVLERSHNKMKTYRGPNISPILANIADEVQAHMISLNMKAGEALIYNHALWHSSPINQSDQHRLAVVYGIIPKAATMMYYYRNKKNVEEYISNLDFFFNNNPKKSFFFNQKKIIFVVVVQ
ncbi:MAG: phytanoyl-CoA dioxygenase family protein [Flavobacteriales bacterium]|nr:phytanoyl-CoA dioxygenase family protein [Flavobacteriales bacterium]